ncbi:MAG: NADH:ubiquinone reductase (Na(+)-transporting) subunit C [Planctomycetota bacterium]
MDFSNKYVLGFATALCLVCAGAVSVLATSLKPQIELNKKLDQQRKILWVSGLAAADDPLPPERVEELYGFVKGRVIDRETGAYADDLTVDTVDPEKESKDPATSIEMPDGKGKGSQVASLPDHLEVFEITKEGAECVVLPIWGKGLWSTMYGYLALAPDAKTVKGITFYAHGETAGLGGEIDNKAWQASWVDKEVYAGGDLTADVVLGVTKYGAPRDESFQVDGLSGATITSKGVDGTVKMWLSDVGYGPYLQKR